VAIGQGDVLEAVSEAVGAAVALPPRHGKRGIATPLPSNATNVTPDKLGLHKKAVPGHDWESL
jgi:hypothetical protein